MLHLIKHSPFFNHALTQCLRYLNQGDVILLLEDGVIAAIDEQLWLEKLTQSKASIFALQEDVIARALVKKISPSINLIDMAGFVALTEKYETIISW